MKALILAGGKGTRLLPLTKKINKHLLIINRKPMILYVIDNVASSGLNEIVIVYNKLGKDIRRVVTRYVKSAHPEVKLKFVFERGAVKGIAHSILEAERAIGNSNFIVIFGDVIFEIAQKKYIKDFSKKRLDAKLLLSRSKKPENHASVFFKHSKLDKIIEKCKRPRNNIVVTTYDIYNSKVWKYIKNLTPSSRGELEISDIRNLMIKNHNVGYSYVKGWWIDAGTPENIKKVAKLLKNKK